MILKRLSEPKSSLSIHVNKESKTVTVFFKTPGNLPKGCTVQWNSINKAKRFAAYLARLKNPYKAFKFAKQL